MGAKYYYDMRKESVLMIFDGMVEGEKEPYLMKI